jgi:hypothetical protein
VGWFSANGLLVVAGLVLAACAAPTPPPEDDPEVEAVLADFRRVVYGSEWQVLGNDGRPRARRDHLAKWELPVRAALIGVEDPGHGAAARRHLDDLAGLTGLDIAEAPAEAANLLIFFAEDPFDAARRHRGLYAHHLADPRSFEALLAGMEPDATCFGFLWGGWPSGRSIDFSAVFIRTDRGERTVQGCLVQETTQILGLINDLDLEAESVFTDSGRHVDLTALDRQLLQLLYDPRLKPGMAWAEAEPLVRAALQEKRGAQLQ